MTRDGVELTNKGVGGQIHDGSMKNFIIISTARPRPHQGWQAGSGELIIRYRESLFKIWVIGNGEHPTRRRDRCGGVAIHEERAHEARAGARVGSTTARFGQ